MTRGSFHWSKDFVEHLRVVHFTLALVSMIFVVTGINGLDTKVSRALVELQSIDKFERKWPPVRTELYSDSLAENKLSDQWTSPLAIVLPQAFYGYSGPSGRALTNSIATYITVPREKLIGIEKWKFSDTEFPEELKTLSDFRSVWNTFKNGVTLQLVKRPSVDSDCDHFLRVTHVDGSVDLEADSRNDPDFNGFLGTEAATSQCKFGAAAMSALGGPTFEPDFAWHESGSRLSLWITLAIAPSTTKYSKNPSIKKVESISEVSVEKIPFRIDEQFLARKYFTGTEKGNFDSAFSELSTIAGSIVGIERLDMADALRRLESQSTLAQPSRDITVVGITLPLGQLSRWGPLLLLLIQVYLWLHLHEFSERVDDLSDGWNVPWIGVYKSFAAFVGALSSACLLPVIAAAVLSLTLIRAEVYYQRAALVGSVTLFLGTVTLAVLTGGKLSRLRSISRSPHAAESAEPGPTPNDLGSKAKGAAGSP